MIKEPVAYDGIENFARSQYEPNNVNHAIGAESQFIYDFDFSPLNRKGRMSDRQRKVKARIEAEEGIFPPSAIRSSTTKIANRLVARCPSGSRLRLQTDEHFQYRRSIQHDLEAKIDHVTISAKAARLYRHILFSVNHTDLLLRQYVKAFARETISFSKSHEAMLLKYALFMAWKNFFRPKFVKPHKKDPRCNRETPAMSVGVEDKILSFGDFFARRIYPTQVVLSDSWLAIHESRPLFPRKRVKTN